MTTRAASLSFITDRRENMRMRKKMTRVRSFWGFRTCKFCGYSGGGWPDSGDCPDCGENN